MDAKWAAIIFPSVSALLGAWIGGWIALHRFKRERAFDRRLDWQEQVFRHATRIQYVASELRHAIEADERDYAITGFEELIPLIRNFALLCYECDLFASDPVRETMLTARVFLARRLAQIGCDDLGVLPEHLKEIDKLLEDVAHELSREYRRDVFPRSLFARLKVRRRFMNAPESLRRKLEP